MSKNIKIIIKGILIILFVAGAFFLFDSLFTQYHYQSQTSRLADNKLVRYSIIFSLIIEGFVLFTKHSKRKVIGHSLLRINISIIYYALFVQHTQFTSNTAYILGVATIISLLLITYKRRKGLLPAFIITLIITVHILITLPGYKQTIDIDSFKQEQQNSIFREKKSQSDNQIVSIFDPIQNTKTSIGTRQANQTHKRDLAKNLSISYASPDTNTVDKVYITLRDGIIIQLNTQSAIQFMQLTDYKKNNDYSVLLTQGNVYIDSIQKAQNINIQTPNGTIKTTTPLYINHQDKSSYFFFENDTAETKNISGTSWTLNPGSYQFPNISSDKQANFDALQTYKDQYIKQRNARRESKITDRNKNRIGHSIIYYKLRLMSTMDNKFKKPLGERNKIGCILYNQQCMQDETFHKEIKHRPIPNI